MGKKSMKKQFSILMAFVLLAAMLAGCGTDKGGKDAPANASTDKLTISYYDSDGTTVLKTQEIDSGATAEEYTPEKEGYTFTGWFATPQLTHEFDFKAAITADTSIFAGFTKFQADTREYYVVGNGKGTLLMSSAWGANVTEEHKLIKSPDANEYSITLDLYEGDEFQFAINGSWHNQRGFGYLTSVEADGKNYFGSSGLGDASTRRSNIKIGVTGNYTFVLTTNPADDTYETDNANYTEDNKEGFNVNAYDTITWTYNGADVAAAAETTTAYFIKGAGITNWADKYTDQTGFKEKEGIHTLEIFLKKGEEFLFTSQVKAGETLSPGTEYVRFSNLDEASQSLFDKTDSFNMIAKADGLYTFTYDPASTVLTAAADTKQTLPAYEYYMKGSFGGTEWGTEGNADYQLVEKSKGSYVYVLDSLKLEAGDEMGMESMKGSERILFYNCANLAASSDTNNNADFAPKASDNLNITAAKSGTYTVTFDAYTGELSFTAK